VSRRSRSIPDGIESLPHWARVAFAARCARAVLPLFKSAWPHAAVGRLASLTRAAEFAERSAATAVTEGGAEDVAMGAAATAGAALMPTYGMSLDEPAPADEAGCCVASFAAKVAEWAARAALGGPTESANAALEAFGFVRQVAEAAEDEGVVTALERDFEVLSRLAARGGWGTRPPSLPRPSICRLRACRRSPGGGFGERGCRRPTRPTRPAARVTVDPRTFDIVSAGIEINTGRSRATTWRANP
jgi:hypothetical protein